MNRRRKNSMKNLKSIGVYLRLTVILFCSHSIFCNAHDQPVHEKIAQSAANSSTSWQGILEDNSLSTDSALTFNGTGRSAIKWIIQGARDEDDTPRFGNHFYTV